MTTDFHDCDRDGHLRCSSYRPAALDGLLGFVADNLPRPEPAAEPTGSRVPFTFTDADGDLLSIGIPVTPASGTPSVSVYTPTGEPVHVPVERVPEVIAALQRIAAEATGQPAPDALPVPAVGDRWHCTTDTGTRVVTVTRVWDTEDAKGGTAVAFDWRDSDGGEYGSALGLPVFLGTYRPEQQPEAAPAPVLSDAERQFLKWTLDLAAEQMASCGDEFDADDEVALAYLRRLAGGEQQ